MSLQQPLALAPPAGHAHWSGDSLLDAGSCRAIASVNEAFLALALELEEEGRLRCIPGLPARAIDALIHAETQRRLCASLPYALFDLRFADGAWWEAQAAGTAAVQDGQPGAAADARIVAFSRAAIMLGWHLAQSRSGCARLALGAAPATIAVLAGLPLAACDGLAQRVAPALSARFGARARFWVLFEGCAQDPDDRAIVTLQRLGLQLQGAESARLQSLQRRVRRPGAAQRLASQAQTAANAT